jgi:phosphoribosylanthranilate isomerase
VQPFGVDVSTGVEGYTKGKKDHGKINAFIQAAKGG